MLDAAADRSLASVAAGDLRPVYVPARPPSELDQRWSVEPRAGIALAVAPMAVVDGDDVTLNGKVAFVPDAPAPICFW